MNGRTMARPRPRAQAGIALIEVLVAVVVLAVGLIGTLGMVTRSYGALADSGNRFEATLAAEKLIGIMTADQPNLSAYALAANGTPSARLQPWCAETAAHIPGAVMQVAVAPPASTGSSKVVITISWTRKAGTSANSHRVAAYIAGAT